MKPAQTFQKITRKLRRGLLRDEPTYYDMFAKEGERYFARLYLHAIQERLEKERLKAPLKILDAGCQAGRLSVPLAQQGHAVVGLDTSDLALRRVKKHARELKTGVQTLRANLTHWLPKQKSGTFDVVVCTEVLYLRSNHQTLLEGLLRLLRPGGLCFISHRPPDYYVAEALGKSDFPGARQVAQTPEGELWGTYYNWQSGQTLTRMYQDAGMEQLEITPIGVFSWLGFNTEELSREERDLLFDLDLSAGKKSRTGRYLLVSGKKP